MSTNRIVRIVVGLALIGYGIYSMNPWFFLGLAPLLTGLINWCPLEMKMGTCDPASGCCATPTDSKNSSCCSTPAPQTAWSTIKTADSACCSNDSECCSDDTIKIEVLGTGCKKCKMLEDAAKEAIKDLKAEYCVIKVEDIQAIANYGVTSTPALVIDGVVKTTGRVLSADEIKALIEKLKA